jgi:hypothetical protein
MTETAAVPSTSLVAFRAELRRDLYDRYVARFPFHGSNQWFINFAMEIFLDECDKQPTFEALMLQGMSEFINKRRASIAAGENDA